jgi:hypothetical protein
VFLLEGPGMAEAYHHRRRGADRREATARLTRAKDLDDQREAARMWRRLIDEAETYESRLRAHYGSRS